VCCAWFATLVVVVSGEDQVPAEMSNFITRLLAKA
jgi:hypothetical protein